MLDDCQIQATLAYFDRREVEIQQQLAYFSEHGPKHVHRLLIREFARERQQIATRRAFLRGLTPQHDQKKKRL